MGLAETLGQLITGKPPKPKEKSGFERWVTLKMARLSYNTKQRLEFYRLLQSLYANEVQIQVALEMLHWYASKKGRKPDRTDAVMLADVLEKFREGVGLAEALYGWAPDEERMMIGAGESGGQISQALEGAIITTQATKRMQQILVRSLIMPAFLAAATVGMLFMFGQQVLPTFAEIVPMEKWTGDAGILAGLTEFTEFQLWIWVGVLGALIVAVLTTLPYWAGRSGIFRLRILLDSIPPWSFYRDLVGVKFLLAFTALQASGNTPTEAMDLLQRRAKPWLRERILATAHLIREGQRLGDALDNTGYMFPSANLIMSISIYSQTRGLDVALGIISREAVEDAERNVKSGAAALNFASILGIAITLMYMIYGLFALMTLIGEQKPQ